MPGFDTVRPAKDNATFWHAIWVSCGKPINTEVHRIMKRTRSIYHYQIRKIKATENKIRANKLLESSLNGSIDLFKEIKKMRKTNNSVANKIDGKNENIPDHFASIYSNVFNSVDDNENLTQIKKIIDTGINSDSNEYINKITPSIVKQASSVFILIRLLYKCTGSVI